MNVHSLDMLPLYLEMSQGQFLSSFEQLQNFEACKDCPSVLDDDTVNRTIKLHEEQKEYNVLTLEQCRRWRLQIVETYIKKLTDTEITKSGVTPEPEIKLLYDIQELICQTKQDVIRSANSSLVILYWNIGKRSC